jgi:hypothetical protein
MAYHEKSAGGALGIKLSLDINGRSVNQTLWATSGDAKGNKNTWKKGDKSGYLPGFVAANHVALLASGQSLQAVMNSSEEKVIKVYDFDTKSDQPTTKRVMVDLLNKEISLGMEKITVNKEEKDGNGDYQPTSETRDINEIVKVFHAKDGRTVAEIKGQSDTGTFRDQWADKYTGVTRIKAKNIASSTGAIGGVASVAKPTEALFQ